MDRSSAASRADYPQRPARGEVICERGFANVMVLDGLARCSSATFTGDGICDDGEKEQKQWRENYTRETGWGLNSQTRQFLGRPESLYNMISWSPAKPVKIHRDIQTGRCALVNIMLVSLRVDNSTYDGM